MLSSSSVSRQASSRNASSTGGGNSPVHMQTSPTRSNVNSNPFSRNVDPLQAKFGTRLGVNLNEATNNGSTVMSRRAIALDNGVHLVHVEEHFQGGIITHMTKYVDS